MDCQCDKGLDNGDLLISSHLLVTHANSATFVSPTYVLPSSSTILQWFNMVSLIY